MSIKKSKTSNNTLKNQNNKTVTMSKNSDKRKKLDESYYKFDKDVLSICYGSSHAAGLKTDGTVVAMCDPVLRGSIVDNEFGQCDVDSWKDIVAIDVGNYHTIGLKSDGTVVVTKGTEDNFDVSSWKNITSICACAGHNVGLKSDGTVVATGDNDYGQCNVSSWKDIVSICAGVYHTVGLKSDGTVVATGKNDGSQFDVESFAKKFFPNVNPTQFKLDFVTKDNNGQCDVDSWTDIVAISAGQYHTVGLKSDGTVVAVGENSYGQCDVDSWKNIVSICTGEDHTVGLRSDGTVVATGKNGSNQCNVKSWKDIVSIGIGTDGISTVGTKSDGTLRSTSKWVNKEFSNYRLFASVKTK